MAKITIDGVEYEVTEPVALAVTTKLRGDAATIQGLEAQLTTARKDATDSQTKATEVQATADKQQARADQAEAKLNERKDTDIGPLVRARIALEKQAGPILGADVKLDDMDDKAIKVAVVKAASPSVVLEGKSDAYLDASYDLIVAGGGDRKDHAADLRRGATPVPASGKGGQEQRVDADEERQKMILRNREMWKNKEGN